MSSKPTSDPREPFARGIEAVSLLDDPVRRKSYFAVPLAPNFIDRDRVASTLGIRRNLAAFHLDKLAQAGLLNITYRRVGEKTGRGAGRPRKLYQRSNHEVSVNLPQRNYPLVAAVLATAIEAAGRRSRDKLTQVAHDRGVDLGKAALAMAGLNPTSKRRMAALVDTLVGYGYEPYIEGEAIFMRNCPFHGLKRDHRDLVCTTNQSLMAGMVEIAAPEKFRAEYQPSDDRCCAVLRPV